MMPTLGTRKTEEEKLNLEALWWRLSTDEMKKFDQVMRSRNSVA